MKTTISYLNYANFLADIAGEIACRYFRAPMEIGVKEGGYPVTQADKEIESVLRQYLMDEYPEHGMLGEEFGEQKGQYYIPDEFQGAGKARAKSSRGTYEQYLSNEMSAQHSQNLKGEGYLWVIDPIDGTTAFAAGKPTFAILIALFEEGRPLFGIIDQPFLQERWVGIQGEKTRFNGKVCCSSRVIELQAARLNCTTPDMFKDGLTQSVFAKLRKEVASVSYGGDAYAYGLLADGHIEVIVEADLKFYDVAAVVPVVEGAGGVITDWSGKRILHPKSFDGTCVAAANAELHGRVLEILDDAFTSPLVGEVA